MLDAPTGLLQRCDALLASPRAHFLLLFGLTLGFYGQTLGYGLVYDDRILLVKAGWHWLNSPWKDLTYYRPLQVLLFLPAIVTRIPWLLHLQNLLVGTVILQLYGRVLTTLGWSRPAAFLAQVTGLALPTSIMLFTWISQRTEWFTLLCGLGTAWMLLARPRPGGRIVAAHVLLSAAAIFAKESGVAVVLLGPLLLLGRPRARGPVLLLAGLGALVVAIYLLVRAQIHVHVDPTLDTPYEFVRMAVLGLASSIPFSTVHICFTYSPLVLALNLFALGLAALGFRGLYRRDRRAALVLTAIFFAFSAGAAMCSEPRNLIVPGLIAMTFSWSGLFDLFARTNLARPGLTRAPLAVALLFTMNLAALTGLNAHARYPLQDWVQPINEAATAAVAPRKPRGYLYEMDVNTDFRRRLSDWLHGKRGNRLPPIERADSTTVSPARPSEGSRNSIHRAAGPDESASAGNTW